MDDKTVFQNPSPQGVNPDENSAQTLSQQPELQTPLQNASQLQQPVQQEPQVINPTIQPELSPTYNPVSTTPIEKSPGGSGSFSKSNIIKLIIGIIAVLIVAFVLLGIFAGTNKSNNKVTLSYWGLFEDPQVISGAIADFEKQNPNITVNYEKEDINNYRERLTTRISQGTGPDIFRFHNTWYPMLSDVLLPLPNDVISVSSFNKSFYPVAKKDLIKNGAIYGIPLEIDTLALFTNSDIFKSASMTPPTNWDDFINAARGLTIKDQNGKIKTAGAAIGTFDNVTHAPDILSLLFVQDGVNLNDLVSSKPKVVDALNFYTAFGLPSGNVWDSTLDSSILAFSKGNLAMYFGYYNDYFTIKSQNPNLKFDINPVPQLSFPKNNIASYWAEGVSSKSKNQKEALLFMKFLAQRQTQSKLYNDEAKARTYGEPPALMDLVGELKNTPLSPFVSQANDATSSYFAGEATDKGISSQLNAYLSAAVNSIISGSTPDSAADAFIKGVSQVFSQYPNR